MYPSAPHTVARAPHLCSRCRKAEGAAFPSHTLPDTRLCSQDVTSYTGGGCGRQKSQTVLTKLHGSSGAGGTDQQSKRMEL